MRHILIITISFCSYLLPNSSAGQNIKFLNPTGLYDFTGKTTKKNGETYGYFGKIKVLLLASDKILVSFFICKGAPSYNSGSFVDTLNYEKNTAIYTGDSTIDRSCKLTFYLTATGINVAI